MEEVEAILQSEDPEEIDLFFYNFYSKTVGDRMLYFFNIVALEYLIELEQEIDDVREGDRIFDDGLTYTAFTTMKDSLDFETEGEFLFKLVESNYEII